MATQQEKEAIYKITYEPTIQEDAQAILDDVKRFVDFLKRSVV